MRDRLTNQQAMSAMFEIAKCLHRSGWLDEVQVDMDSVLRFIQQSPWITDGPPSMEEYPAGTRVVALFNKEPYAQVASVVRMHWREGKQLPWMPLPPPPEVKE
jgi:hypothetical protein